MNERKNEKRMGGHRVEVDSSKEQRVKQSDYRDNRTYEKERPKTSKKDKYDKAR